ncbi:penicillin-binding protein [Streptomyces sp. WAC05374]|uniref:penicillin-binding transpeptidase domain-containing protein n=1 Tax=Streptomyces sp. WAC05374 TaxID=2487420 RepID=UPI000F88E50F|nr:penicillin-binding transpeptidase domain-containing protein [Streptomyces sp. WAC05374]RST13417.1 penicillin-binding protein [Streptomyces sp. WAC05374]TDF47062.1 penicillin-binding protein [Streptomyces sp. WAC05374]TDF57318.1 penicillin-binding protein [Streptomyces sp. WAC05374]TDF61423.1 penicillin-binding protein [Streptomyces sp. WAC05374]
MRSGAKVAIVGGVFTVVAGGVGYGAYNLWNGITGGAEGTTTTSAAAPRTAGSGPVTAEEVERTARDFLAAWAAGDDAAAGELTDNADTAAPAVQNFREVAHVSKAVITPGKPVGTKVPFTVDATVTYEGKSKRLTYASELTVVRGVTTGRPLVDWKPAVIHPQLTGEAVLRTGEAPNPPVKAVDHRGVELTPEKYPSLKPVLAELREKYGSEAGGRPGIETWIDDAAGGAPDRTLLTLAEGRPGELRTTLDAGVQAAAERAVKRYGESSVVAIKPSTGEIRAVANNRKDAFNAAFEGKQAPGSTLKMVTAALLLEKGLAAKDRPAECPKSVMYEGRTFHNLRHFALADGSTFEESFKRSCNTAFIKLIDDVGDDSALGTEARDVFGIGLNWQTGVRTWDGSVPAETGGEAAAQYIGQGTVQMNVLNVASITATAKNGSFKQPVIVPRDLDDRPIASAARPLEGSAARQLRDMMRATATSGTGAAAMAGVGGDKGAKTGSAEVGGQADSNSWFAGFADDLAAAAVVQAGGHGGDAAGPLVAAVLNAR